MKFGIAGFGRMAELVHLPIVRALPGARITGVFDVTAERRALASKRGFSAFGRLPDLLASGIDALIVATPPGTHYEIASQALQYGVHVVIEKPVACSYPEAERLRQLAERTGKVATVFHNRRYDPDYKLVRRIVGSGELGGILVVQRRHHMFGSGASFAVKSFMPDWRNRKAYGGGALLDWGVHLIDQLLQLRLGNPVEVRADLLGLRWNIGDVEDFCQGLIHLDTGVVLHMEINFASGAPETSWIVGGDRATLQIGGEQGGRIVEKGQPVRHLPIDRSGRLDGREIYTLFMEAVRFGGEPAVMLEEASLTMKVADAFARSAELGAVVNLRESG